MFATKRTGWPRRKRFAPKCCRCSGCESTIENIVIAYVTLSRIKSINGHYGEAMQLLDYLHSMLEGGSHVRFLAQVCAEKIRLFLSQDNLQRARAVATGVWLAAAGAFR